VANTAPVRVWSSLSTSQFIFGMDPISECYPSFVLDPIATKVFRWCVNFKIGLLRCHVLDMKSTDCRTQSAIEIDPMRLPQGN
jgi:hypothetical protein